MRVIGTSNVLLKVQTLLGYSLGANIAQPANLIVR
jgi:hypothetical protein